MNTQRLDIGGIPAIIWGSESDKVYIHVHGKLSRKENAAQFARIAEKKGYQTLSFDLPEHGERSDNHEVRCDIFSGMRELPVMADYAFSHWRSVSLCACSLGAYFSLNSYADRALDKCLFLSPVLDMAYLIGRMFAWFGVTPERLRAEGEIPTPLDSLRWDYFQYLLAHPVRRWDIPTFILYGAKDQLQSRQVVQAFADRHHAQVTVAQNSDHPFMQAGDQEIVAGWLEDRL